MWKRRGRCACRSRATIRKAWRLSESGVSRVSRVAEMSTAAVIDVPDYVADWAIVTDFREAEEIVQSPDFHAGHMETESLPFRGDSIIELDAEAHVPRRQLEGRLFARAALRHYEAEALDQSIQGCLTDLGSHRDPDGVVRANLVEVSRTILLQIAAALIGLDDLQTE